MLGGFPMAGVSLWRCKEAGSRQVQVRHSMRGTSQWRRPKKEPTESEVIVSVLLPKGFEEFDRLAVGEDL